MPVSGHVKLTWCACRNMRLRPHRLHLLVEFGLAVLVVARERIAGVARVHADLVGAAGLERDLAPVTAPLAEDLHRLEDRSTASLPDCVHLHRALAADADVGAQRRVDALRAELPACPSPARDSASPPCPSRMQRLQLDAAPRGLRAMSSSPLVSRSSRCTSSSVSSGRAARSASMTPKLMPLPPWTATPGGLVDHEQARVLEHDRAGQCPRAIAGGRPSRRRGCADAYRRDPHDVARQQPGVRLSTRFPLTRTSPLRIIAEQVSLRHVLEHLRRGSCPGAARRRVPDLDQLRTWLGSWSRASGGTLRRWRHRCFVTSCFH